MNDTVRTGLARVATFVPELVLFLVILLVGLLLARVLARVIAGGVGAVVLEIHGRAGAAAGELTGLAAPDLGPQRQAHPAGGGEGVGMALLERGGGHGLGRESASAKISR